MAAVIIIEEDHLRMVFFVCKTPFRCAMMYIVRKKNVRNAFRAWRKCCGWGVGNAATSVKVLNNTTEKLLDDLKDTIRKGSRVSITEVWKHSVWNFKSKISASVHKNAKRKFVEKAL